MRLFLLMLRPLSLLLLAVFSLFPLASRAQTLRGVVRESDTGAPVTGATVSLYSSKSGGVPVSLASSPEGEFVFEQLKPGYYRGEVAAVGFETVYFSEILVAAGKEQVLELALRHADATLPEVTIAASVPGRRSQQPLSEIPLTRDQTLRFPSMYFDPGRLAAAYPGVQQTDDGTNNLSIRGNSPAFVRWRMEGLDIVNPNHLPNAGTVFDAPAAAGGGVLMFSAQMLDNSSLLTGAFPAGYGDAVAGVMDMNLRAGNNRHHEFTVQTGLVGIDVAAEGPLKKGKDHSFLANYRYSTVGLLGQLGVSFGDEQINFQDLSFHLNFKGEKGAQFSLFGMGGLSENRFSHREDSLEIKIDKEHYDIDFESKTGVLGGTAKWKLDNRNWLKAALAYSAQDNNWSKRHAFKEDSVSVDQRLEEKIALSLEWRLAHKFHQVAAGLQATHINFKGYVFQVLFTGPFSGIFITPYDSKLSYNNLQPWARWDWSSPNGRWSSQMGLQIHYNDVRREWAPAPRGILTYRPARAHKLALTAGLYHQDAPVWMQFVKPDDPFNLDFDFRPPYLRSQQAGLRYTWAPAVYWKINAELFLQDNKNIPTTYTGSLVNAPEAIFDRIYDPQTRTTKVRNYGVEVGVERSLESGWFFAANSSLFRSKYKDISDWLPSRWDIGHIANATFGKEWIREKSTRLTRTIGVGLRGVWTGGVREADIDLETSKILNTTSWNERYGYYKQYPDYFRVDLRVYWKRSLGDRRNSTFALDIQNLTGQVNLAYHYYDPFTGGIENKYQLGPIPNFSWRLEL